MRCRGGARTKGVRSRGRTGDDCEDCLHGHSQRTRKGWVMRTGQSGDIPEKVKNGDQWLESRLGPYARWAMTHNSLLVITWDENSDMNYTASHTRCPPMVPPSNQIATVLVGERVKPGSTSGTVNYNHYDLLRTIEDMYGLPHLGNSGNARD